MRSFLFYFVSNSVLGSVCLKCWILIEIWSQRRGNKWNVKYMGAVQHRAGKTEWEQRSCDTSAALLHSQFHSNLSHKARLVYGCVWTWAEGTVSESLYCRKQLETGLSGRVWMLNLNPELVTQPQIHWLWQLHCDAIQPSRSLPKQKPHSEGNDMKRRNDS